MTTDRRLVATWIVRPVLAVSLCLGVVACEDTQSPTAPSEPTQPQPEPPAASSVGNFRAAQLTRDARTVDVLVDGIVLSQALAYGEVMSYQELPEGEHRLQIFPAGQRRVALVESNFLLNGGEAVTLAVVGRNPFEIVEQSDDLSTVSSRARVTLFNAVLDYPANFDLRVVNGPLLVTDVARYTGSPSVELIPGVYAFELLRGGTGENVTTRFGVDLPASTASTVFAIGTLDRSDIELIVVRDAS
ncbi:MAG TPA: DUF4397 domain-containing protein [Vicinamibacteria bacterium]|nr:DUF4397 domain-containing protein [Vicinamibacteria bacterium]